jgi:hypothetical protein
MHKGDILMKGKNILFSVVTIVALLLGASYPTTAQPSKMVAKGDAEINSQVQPNLFPLFPLSEVLDQYQTVVNYGFWFEDDVIRWQEFVPNLNNVTSVELFIDKRGSPGNMVTQIRTTGGTVLAQKTVVQADVPSYGWVRVEFSTPATVTPGNKYRIYVYSDQHSPSADDRYFWRGNTASTYCATCETDVSGGWPNYDYTFKTFGRSGAGYALQFDGLDDFVSIADNGVFDFENTFTVEAWVKPDSLSGSGSFKSFLGGNTSEPPFSGSGWQFFLDTADYTNWGLSVCVPACDSAKSGSGNLQVGEWQHVAGTFDGSNIRIYKNGDLITTQAHTGNVSDINFVLVGIWETSFSGMMDEVRIWNVARSQSEIRANKSTSLQGDEIGLVGYWRFDEGSGQVVSDRADDDNPGRLGSLSTSDDNDPVWALSDAPINFVGEVADVSLSLRVEDALEGVTVNKVTGDQVGPTFYTRLEIVATLFTFDANSKDDVSVILTIPDNLFESPDGTWVRDTFGGTKTPVSYTNLDNGKTRVTTDLAYVCDPICSYRKQIVWRFLIPNNLTPQLVNIEAELQVPEKIVPDPYATGLIRIVAPGSVRSIIVANRKLLYENYTESAVTSLLNRLFSEAVGHPASHSPLAVIYYVERYDTRAYNWDNTAVDYTNSATANQTADAIDDLIEDWHNDATEYVSIFIPFYGYLDLPVSWPSYLMIVGDDDTIPFYRYDDPSNDEGINNRPDCPAADGWCVDSNTNPAIRATDEDYFFTDNPYADLAGGTDWQTGDVELWVGRLLGEDTADMLSLLDEGVSWANGQQGGVVMASVDGWELGLEPDPGGAGHIADINDVPAILRGKGFQVRNDDNPASEVRTIDVMFPFEGGNASWNTNFKNAANNVGGMDIFFIGGHNSYDHASIPGDDFSPDDTCAAPTCDYNRFDNDNPIAMIVGCHGGLPVPDIDVDGGVNDNMVYDLVHEGASAYIGATGFSYGSPNNLHRNTWGERLMQDFFGRLVMPPGGNSMTVGKALAEAKSGYVFGFGGNDALDRKTVTEFNLYGVPWTFVYYPNGGTATQTAAHQQHDQVFTTQPGPVESTVEGVYTRSFEVNIEAFSAGTETQGNIVYDLISIEGGEIAIAENAPILPYIESYSMTLPYSSTVTAVQIVELEGSDIGDYNIPIAQVEPWSEGGLNFTTTTDIQDFYPSNLVEYQETSEGLLFTIFPIQHNPTTNETTFYNHFKVEVTYESPLTIAVTDFSTDKMAYGSGGIANTINTFATIENVSDASEALTATLTIKDELGGIMGTQVSEEFTVPAGGSKHLQQAWTGPLNDGSYLATITLWKDGEIAGAASTGFWVESHTIYLPIIMNRLK